MGPLMAETAIWTGRKMAKEDWMTVFSLKGFGLVEETVTYAHKTVEGKSVKPSDDDFK